MLLLILGSFLIFIILSQLFSLYPRLLHSIFKPKFEVTHISHRGGAGENVENTLFAFKSAFETGTDMLELDVHLTKDKEVVVVHDSELERAFSATTLKTIEELNLIELPRYKENLEITFYPKHYFQQIDPSLRCIPKLEEIFAAFPNMPINLDIKVNDDLLIEKVASLIEKYKREEITVWGSFSQEASDKCYQRNPKIPLFFPFRDAVLSILYYHLGLFSFMSCRYTHMELPSLSIMMNNLIPELLPWVKSLPRLFYVVLRRAVKWFFFSKSMRRHWKARGISLYIWVCNNEQMYEEAFNLLGAEAVMTDYPERLARYLETKEDLNWSRRMVCESVSPTTLNKENNSRACFAGSLQSSKTNLDAKKQFFYEFKNGDVNRRPICNSDRTIKVQAS